MTLYAGSTVLGPVERVKEIFASRLASALEELDEEPGDDLGLLEVRDVAGAGDDLEARAGDLAVQGIRMLLTVASGMTPLRVARMSGRFRSGVAVGLLAALILAPLLAHAHHFVHHIFHDQHRQQDCAFASAIERTPCSTSAVAPVIPTGAPTTGASPLETPAPETPASSPADARAPPSLAS